MSPKTLQIALKHAVDDLGVDVLKSPNLVNILADYHAFDVHDRDLQKRKRIIAEFVEKRFPDNLLRWKRYRLTYKDKCVGWINENFNEYMLDATTATLVKDVACAFLFSCGLDSDMSFCLQQHTINTTQSSSQIKQRLKAKPSNTPQSNTSDLSADVLLQQLDEEYQKYIDLCRSFIHVEVDEFGLKLASFDVVFPKAILTHRNKIRYLEKKMGLPGTDFFTIRQELINESSSSKEEIRLVYDKLLEEYKSICDHKVAFLGMKKNGLPEYGYKAKTILQFEGYQKKLLKICPYLNVSSGDLKDDLKRFQREAISTLQLKREKALNSGVIKRYADTEPPKKWGNEIVVDRTKRNKTILITIIIVIAVVLLCLMIAFPEEFFAILIGVPLAYVWLFGGNRKK